MSKNIFSYSWHIDEKEDENLIIRVYGLNEDNETICLQIDDFTPYIYIELPTNVIWNRINERKITNKLNEILQMNDRNEAKTFSLVYKKKLYGVYLDKMGERQKFPYLFVSCYHPEDIKTLYFRTRKPIKLEGLGDIQLKIHEQDANPILQLVSFKDIPTAGWFSFKGREVTDEEDKETLCDYEYIVKYKNLKTSDLYQLPKPTIMGFDIEVYSSNPNKMPQAKKSKDKVFQISCVITKECDDVNQYFKYLLTLGDPDQSTTGDDIIIQTYKTECLLLEGFANLIREEKVNILVGYNILGFDIPYMIERSEGHASCPEFKKQGLHKTKDGEKKIIKWSSSAYRNQEFEFLDSEGILYVDLLPLVKRDYKFNNYKLKTISEYFLGSSKDPLSVKGIFQCYEMGIKRNNNGEYSNKARKAMGIVGKYCVQDSALVVQLMGKLKIWVGLTEMAKTCNVPIFTLYTQGQQIKVYSQLYKYCMRQNIVVEKDAYKVKENERYVGAKVFPPVPGKYNMVVPFDFASLYPTTIIAYNIDYHTWVPPGSNIPDKDCHVMEWEDHISCQHDPKIIRKNMLDDYINSKKEYIKKLRTKRNAMQNKKNKDKAMINIKQEIQQLKPYTEERADIVKTISKSPMCEKRSYRFLKHPKGVMPTIIQNLLDARKKTRKQDMKRCYEKIEQLKQDLSPENLELIKQQETLIDVLNKRQLAYKVSANSMYGAMGVKKGYLPFMPGAMCTTYMGRQNIEVVAKVIPEKYGGQLIYGDTDSNYINFPQFTSSQETWDFAEEVAEKVTKLFPQPIQLEFEQEIYAFFFILSKKRYMYRKCLRDGNVEDKIGKKGVLLARRDNSLFVRNIYENVISKISNDVSYQDILYYVLQEINEMCSNQKDPKDFIITKAVGNSNDLIAEVIIDEKNEVKYKVGDYKCRLLCNCESCRDDNLINSDQYKGNLEDETCQLQQELTTRRLNTIQEHFRTSLPAQVQLANKMRKRGVRVDNGSRLEYIVSDPDNHNIKQYEKIESYDYYMKHRGIVNIDYLYYLKVLINPLDQVLDVAFSKHPNFKKGFVKTQYDFRWKIRYKLLQQLKSYFSPMIKFKE